MTEAYAIKEGEKFVAYGNTENDAWGALLLARPHVPFDADRQRFHCVPVVVSEFEEPLSPELAKKYPLDRRLRIFIEQLMLADDVAKEFDYEEAKRLHRELVDRLTAVSEKEEAPAHGLAQSDHPTAESLSQYVAGGCTESNCRLCATPTYARKNGMRHAGLSAYAVPEAEPAQTYLSRGQR